MKKKCVVVISILLVLVICVVLWFVGYFSYKSYDNIPSMSNVATMEEADINSLLPGYRIEQLIEVWGEPETMNANEAIWRLSDDICLRVNFKNNGKIAVCGLYELMGGE